MGRRPVQWPLADVLGVRAEVRGGPLSRRSLVLVVALREGGRRKIPVLHCSRQVIGQSDDVLRRGMELVHPGTDAAPAKLM